MQNLSRKIYFPLLGLVFVLAAYIRFRVAPLSAGPDVAQFWAFAEIFRMYGLDFYRFADAHTNFFPFQYWSFVYPPIWLLILGLALLAAPSSAASSTMVDPIWRLAMKTPIIVADLAIGGLLYWAIPGSRCRKLLFTCLWLFNPTVWYNSAVFGQFDALAAALLMASVIMLERGRDRLAFILAVLAGLTKQNAFLPVAIMIIAVARQIPWRRVLSHCAVMAGIAIAISIPFVVTGNFSAYFHSVLLPGQAPAYQEPLMYAFNGPAAFLTYGHDVWGWNTVDFFQYFIVALIIAFIAVVVLAYFRRISMIRGALIGILVFIAFFYRINYQYLIIFIPLALLAAATTPYKSERVLTLILALFPAAWMWIFDVSFWFNYLDPKAPEINTILGNLGLNHQGIPDYIYVAFALALTGLCLSYIICALTIWRQPLKTLTAEHQGVPLDSGDSYIDDQSRVNL